MRKIESISDIDEINREVALKRMMGFVALFRGEGSSKYKLRSTLCRYNNDISELKKIEKGLIKDFRVELSSNKIEHLVQNSTVWNKYQYGVDWFNLFQYQHLGLPTRLIDWSSSYENALYFAIDDKEKWDEDGQYWISFCQNELFYPADRASEYLNVPYDHIRSTLFINHPFLEIYKYKQIAELRRYNQSGRFSIQPLEESISPLESQNLSGIDMVRFIVDRNAKRKLFIQLGERNINYTRIYQSKIPILKEIIDDLKLRYGLIEYR